MIRILIFILSVILAAGVATYAASLPGRFEATIFGTRISMHGGLAVAVVVLSALTLVGATIVAKDIAGLPRRIREREAAARRDRGVAALARGLEAVAVGDATDARHHARIARRNLDDGALTRLLTAQAAQLAGDDAEAEAAFSAMLEAPETEFLGLRGLYAKAIRAGDKETARTLAERAFKLRPNAGWAFDAVFDLGLERGAWGEMREALAAAARARVVTTDEARRGEAALLAADAQAALLAGDRTLALNEAEAAARLAPAFAPAAVLAARLSGEAGRAGKGARILETAFAASPHPALVAAALDLHADEPDAKRADRLARLAERNPSSREARIARARAALLAGRAADAVRELEDALVEAATGRECAMMAEAVAAAHGPDAARTWLRRAAAAPRDPTPGADGAFAFTRAGWADLVRNYMRWERLAPPPLEGMPLGLAREEVRLLLAPPPSSPPAPETPMRAENTQEASEAPAAEEPASGASAGDEAMSDGTGHEAAARQTS